MENKTAVIFGVTGQDGSYLSELLLEKEYNIIGVCRRCSVDNTERVKHIQSSNFTLVEGDITDASSVTQIISGYKPDECYNLAAMSHVGTSFSQPMHTFDVDAVGVLNILESIRLYSPKTRFMQASTSEMFGNNYNEYLGDLHEVTVVDGMMCDKILEYGSNNKKYQDEYTALSPNSPYAVAKVTAHHLCQNYRRAYNLYISSMIMFNHESPRRGKDFVTRKITKWIGEFVKAMDSISPVDQIITLDDNIHIYQEDTNQYVTVPCLRLGNIDAMRDWGHAKDTVRAQYMSLQQDKPDDYVIATEKTRSVRDFLTIAFKQIGIDDWDNLIVIDPKFYRPSDVEYLCGRSYKAKKKLGWEPKISFDELVKEMVQYDVEKAKEQVISKEKVYERSQN